MHLVAGRLCARLRVLLDRQAGLQPQSTTAEIIGQLWHANRALKAGGESAKGRPERELLAQPSLGGKAHSAKGASMTAPWVEHGRQPITNVVMMGMGEPLANYDNVVSALTVFLDDNAYGLSRRRVTLSTSGIVPAIDKLRDDCPVALAVSLHAGNDTLRDQLVPINRKYPLAQLLAACLRYLERAPRDFVTFEYVMLDGVNDSTGHARELAALVRDVPCKFNLIPWNPFAGADFKTSPRARILAFQAALTDAGYVATIRKTRGDDIDAACGQLAGRVQDRTKRTLRIQPARATPATH